VVEGTNFVCGVSLLDVVLLLFCVFYFLLLFYLFILFLLSPVLSPGEVFWFLGGMFTILFLV
jgi:hypothetical protein